LFGRKRSIPGRGFITETSEPIQHARCRFQVSHGARVGTSAASPILKPSRSISTRVMIVMETGSSPGSIVAYLLLLAHRRTKYRFQEIILLLNHRRPRSL